MGPHRLVSTALLASVAGSWYEAPDLAGKTGDDRGQRAPGHRWVPASCVYSTARLEAGVGDAAPGDRGTADAAAEDGWAPDGGPPDGPATETGSGDEGSPDGAAADGSAALEVRVLRDELPGTGDTEGRGLYRLQISVR